MSIDSMVKLIIGVVIGLIVIMVVAIPILSELELGDSITNTAERIDIYDADEITVEIEYDGTQWTANGESMADNGGLLYIQTDRFAFQSVGETLYILTTEGYDLITSEATVRLSGGVVTVTPEYPNLTASEYTKIIITNDGGQYVAVQTDDESGYVKPGASFITTSLISEEEASDSDNFGNTVWFDTVAYSTGIEVTGGIYQKRDTKEWSPVDPEVVFIRTQPTITESDGFLLLSDSARIDIPPMTYKMSTYIVPYEINNATPGDNLVNSIIGILPIIFVLGVVIFAAGAFVYYRS